MTIRRAFAISLALCGVAFLISILVGPTLPDVVATHWNAAGQVDGRGSKWMALLIMPCMMVGMSVLMLILPSLSPKKFEIGTFTETYGIIWVLVTSMFLGLHMLFLQGAKNEAFEMTRWIPSVIFLFIALMGNWMGKLRRNFYVGIRTPWTLADERVWDRSHQIGGRIWFFGGIAGFVLSIVGTPFWVSMIMFAFLAIYPIYLSWKISKELT